MSKQEALLLYRDWVRSTGIDPEAQIIVDDDGRECVMFHESELEMRVYEDEAVNAMSLVMGV